MINSTYCRRSLFLLTLAIASGSGAIAQDHPPGSNGQPPFLDSKRASKLAVDESAPEYPPVAKVNYIEGVVYLKLLVDPKGIVNYAHVLEGNALLAAAAVNAARRWVYLPLTTLLGPSEFMTTVRLKFSLANWEASTSLSPKRAEEDFLRQVKPPQVVRPPANDYPTKDVVHMRLLVNDRGQVVDTDVAAQSKEQVDAASETLQGWTIHPAHWGNNPVASYLDVDVPVSATKVAKITHLSDSN
jgi:TonB family protein